MSEPTETPPRARTRPPHTRGHPWAFWLLVVSALITVGVGAYAFYMDREMARQGRSLSFPAPGAIWPGGAPTDAPDAAGH